MRGGWSERPEAHLCRLSGLAHFRHGPIDLSIMAEGPASAVKAALQRAWARFQPVLAELSGELSLLRQDIRALDPGALRGSVAQRMAAAALAQGGTGFVTPMAAVAGAVADEILAAAWGAGLSRLAVNNGGDIAFRLTPGAVFTLAMAGANGADLGRAEIAAADLPEGRGGIATSGWRGRSFSLGVADSVTVLAASAAAADVAATLIANAVDAPDLPGVERAPARALAPDSDLGDRLVTTAVAPLGPKDRRRALDAGLRSAEGMRRQGLITAAVLALGPDRLETPATTVPSAERSQRFG